MQKKASETMTPPRCQRAGLSPRKRAKLRPARAEPLGKMLEECGPFHGLVIWAALTATRGGGAHRPQ